MAYRPYDQSDRLGSHSDHERPVEPKGAGVLWVLAGIVLLVILGLWALGGSVQEPGGSGAGGAVEGVDIVPPAEIGDPAPGAAVID